MVMVTATGMATGMANRKEAKHLRRSKWLNQAVGVAALLGFLSATVLPAFAGDWEITPRIKLKEYYTDNIRLAAPGNERHEFVTEVSPTLRIVGRGARLTANVLYRYQNLYYQRDSRPRRAKHQLQANGTAELVEHIAFIDARATMREENVDNSGVVTSDNINVSGNRTDVQRLALARTFDTILGLGHSQKLVTPTTRSPPIALPQTVAPTECCFG